MPFSACIIIALIGGFVMSVLLKLVFNKITGKNASDRADMGQFFGMFIACFVIILIIMIVATLESHM